MVASAQHVLRFGQFTLDPNRASLSRAGTDVPLRPKSFDVLLYLARNPERVVSKAELIEAAWPEVFVTDNSLVQCISDIREALADDAQDILKTVARRGYLFAAKVAEVDDSLTDIATPRPSEGLPPAHPARRSRSIPAGILIAALVVILAGGLAWWLVPGTATDTALSSQGNARTDMRDSSAHSVRTSIAVLPFTNLGGTPSDDYFARGLIEDIIAALSRFPNLNVLSIKTVLPFANKPASPAEIGRELHVRYIAAGSIRRSSQRIRITIQLTDATNGALIWADQYDREPAGIFAIQDDITTRITGALAVRLNNAEQARAAAKPPGNLEAYDLVLQGRNALTRLTRSATSQARQMFEKAVAIDPNFAVAYVGLGMVDLRAIHHGWTSDPSFLLERAKSYAFKAIALDEFDPHAHALLGRVYARLGQYDRAVETLKRATALNSNDPDNLAGLGDALLWSGDIAGAIAALKLADQLDPQLSTQDLFNLGAAYFLGGKHVDAARVFERAAARNEGNAFVHAMLAAIYQDAGRTDDARRALAETHRLNPFFNTEAFGSLFRNSQHRTKIISALRKAAS